MVTYATQKKEKQLAVYVDEATFEKLRQVAEIENRSISNFVSFKIKNLLPDVIERVSAKRAMEGFE